MRSSTLAFLFLVVTASVQAQTASVQGRVINAETGEPMANIPVDLRSVHNTTPRVWRTTHTDADGTFALEALPNERPHRLRAVVASPTADFILITPSFRADTTAHFTFAFTLNDAAQPEATFGFVPDPSAPRRTLMGTVFDAATGQPLPDATVAIHSTSNGALRPDGRFAYVLHTDSTGRYAQRVPTTEGRAVITVNRLGFSLLSVNTGLDTQGSNNFYLLETATWIEDIASPIGYVRHAGSNTAIAQDAAALQALEMRSGMTGALHLKQDAPTLLTGQILSGDTPAAGAMVELLGTPYTAVTDNDGRFFLGELPAAMYRFRIVYGSTEETTPQLLLTRGLNDFAFTLDAAEN
ncbi:MAG: carboxypeptidase regulatory-like domain-containing protein [Bacteroidota bacterium]